LKFIISIIVLVFFVLFEGSFFYNPFAFNEAESVILFQLRLPRTLLAFIVGGVLATCGHIYQLLLKNDLASPFTLGVASASSLGATFAIFLGLSSLVTIFSLGFSLIPMLVMIYLLRTQKVLSQVRILLAGVIISYLCSSLVVLMQVLSSEGSLREILFWLLGDLNIVGLESFYLLIPASLIFLYVCHKHSPDLVKMSVGEVFATNLGVDVKKVHFRLILVTIIMIAMCVSVCGPIAFVGIIIPHAVRMFSSKKVELLVFDLFLSGGIFLAFCEYCAQTLLVSYNIPVGVISSLVGAPFFIVLLLRFNFR